MVGTTLINLLLGRVLSLEVHHREKQKACQILYFLNQIFQAINPKASRHTYLLNSGNRYLEIVCLDALVLTSLFPLSNTFTMFYLHGIIYVQ